MSQPKHLDLEAFLRTQLGASFEAPIELRVWVNNEKRVVATLSPPDAKYGTEFVVFGNNVAPYEAPPEEPEKPPTQRASIPGIDSFGGMGARP